MKNLFLISVLVMLFAACNNSQVVSSEKSCYTSGVEAVESGKTPPVWTKDATIYEVNLRQYTEAGTFNAFAEELPRLKEMGVDILWLMPIHPIGEVNRKGELGSYYSVKDYYGINPEFGTMDDFKLLVNKIHEMGMYVIIDMVANHTSWDNNMIVDHPEWYTLDSTGNMVSPFDWSDVADLNYEQPELRNYMVKMLKFWVKDINIDGYRCDVAGMVPDDFWVTASDSLNAIKPVFMLAEDGELHTLENGFNANYAWSQLHLQNEVASGEKNAEDIVAYLKKVPEMTTPTTFQMNFITNHDENSWNGTYTERLGKAWKVFTVYNYTQPGMPLIYSGQEAGNEKRLEFFTKDLIEWRDHPANAFFTKLNALKRDNPALFSAPYGGEMTILETNKPEDVVAFVRKKDNNMVLSVLNFSKEAVDVKLKMCDDCNGIYQDFFAEKSMKLNSEIELSLEPNGFYVFVR